LSHAAASAVRWAIVGPGRIAHQFAQALKSLPGARLAAVVGRDRERAAAFAAQWGDSATSVANDLVRGLTSAQVDAVYVATPHPFHADAVRVALHAGKAVLCEKPLTPNAAVTAELIGLAGQHNAFLMEAVWTRFLPIYGVVQRWLDERRIGAVRGMQSRFCIDIAFAPDNRCHDPHQAGGALLDVGIYNLNVSRWVMANAPVRSFDVHAALGPLGCDQRLSARLDFGGAQSQFICGFDGVADNNFHIVGEHGHITVHSGFWRATSATLAVSGSKPQTERAPLACNGFEYQIAEVHRCLAHGLLQSPVMPWAESLAVVTLMDAMRERIGLRYPFE
jgi:predicted dehydrogenase